MHKHLTDEQIFTLWDEVHFQTSRLPIGANRYRQQAINFARAILAQSAPAATAPSDGARQAEKSLAAIDKALRGRVNDPDPLPKLHAHTAAGEPTTYGLVAGLLRERDALLAKVGKFDQRIVDLGVLAMETAAPAPTASPAALTDDEAWAKWDRIRATKEATPKQLIGIFARALLAAQPPAAAEADKRDAERWRLAAATWKVLRVEVVPGVVLSHAKGIPFEDLVVQIDAAMGKEGM